MTGKQKPQLSAANRMNTLAVVFFVLDLFKQNHAGKDLPRLSGIFCRPVMKHGDRLVTSLSLND